MAASVAVVKRAKNLTEFAVIADITLDNSYTTGGYALTPAQFGLQNLDFIAVDNSGGYGYSYDSVGKKLKVYACAAAASPMAEVAAATNLSAVTARVVAYGI